ncbi:transmembrane protein 256 [Myiozetetes cayanensis]|uniref:transmembrane protein 256 n=1 Tax=Myiozetetes cayanensis TaxID=478635 RepID=UPI00215E2EE3|nr:transmembrane protein 256 [Myiozetetes cayanensis]
MAAAWARLGALSRAGAMAAAAYGAHGLRRSDHDEYQKEVTFLYENRQSVPPPAQFGPSGDPHCRHPHLAGSLFLAGLGLFCVPFYFHGLSGDPKLNRGPLGGTLLILGWAAMAL